MEFKVRKESMASIEKIFHNHATDGKIKTKQLLTVLKSLIPDVKVTEEELRLQTDYYDKEGEGYLDYDAFSKVVIHFLLIQTRRATDEFAHKKLIRMEDFPDHSQEP